MRQVRRVRKAHRVNQVRWALLVPRVRSVHKGLLGWPAGIPMVTVHQMLRKISMVIMTSTH